MIKRLISALAFLFLAGFILAASIFRTAQVKYDFRAQPSPTPDGHTDHVHVDYILPPTSYINPSHPLWPLKVSKDKLWLFFTVNSLKKAQINLYLANNRLVYAQQYYEQDRINEAIRVVDKAEIYLLDSYNSLEKAHERGDEIADFSNELALAALKHRDILETFLRQSPEDAAPQIAKTMDTSKIVYEKTSHIINSIGKNPPNNPFN